MIKCKYMWTSSRHQDFFGQTAKGWLHLSERLNGYILDGHASLPV